MRLLIFVSVVCYYVCVVRGQSCTTPNGIGGTCMDVLNCKPLADIVNSNMLTQADVDFLRKSQCGTGSTPYTVCCPPDNDRQQNNCFTPDGISGRCVDIYECNHIAALLNPPVSQQNINTIKSLQCPGKTEYSVCCAATPTNQNNNGNTQNNCFTPDNKAGRCVDIYQCDHMAALLNPPVTQQSINLIKQSQCPGPSEYSVCCGPAPITKYNGQGPRRCKDNVSAYPPDPSTECCGLDSVAGNKIVGGTETRIDQYPWLALINFYKNGAEVPNLVCGGALISGRYVLTAAHCLAPMQRGTARMVTLGEYDRSHDGPDCTLVEAGGQDCTDEIKKIPIESFKMHEEYDPNTIRNDIGLIRLATMAPYTDFIRPICLPRTDLTLSPPANFTLYSAGWGAANTREPSSALKLHVDLPFVNAEQCKRKYSFVWDKHVCAGGVAGKDTCKGDSGGPLMFENGRIYEVLGVVSFGLIACGTQNSPGVYTKVFEYKQWITSNINP